ncbi:hypothetical protein FW774_13260 [Pedobacter sp. BS3]|uniref:hypothetical protein n=1 Tax=Pedobacter sp. BS3 TaxID=2567937 RepID=UPI0011EEFB8F|nr:hypothetical protein [Pedobacter sp. BS3]TZF83251.1 hypothetical protein FW774_13260 [Pedobacter sp. BS3]
METPAPYHTANTQFNNETAIKELLKVIDKDAINQFLDHTFLGYIKTQEYAEQEELKRSDNVFAYQMLKQFFNNIRKPESTS